MASEQARRETTTSEREIPVEKDRVPKMTSHFESLAEQASTRESLPQEGGEDREESQFESLADKVKNEKEREEEEEEEKCGEDKEGEAREGREKRSYAVGKFEVNGAGDQAKCREAGGEAMEVGRKEEIPQKEGERKEVRSKEEVLLNL